MATFSLKCWLPRSFGGLCHPSVTKCKFALRIAWQANEPEKQGLRQGRDFNWGAGWQRRWQASTSKWPSYRGVWKPGSFIDQRWEKVRKQSKKSINLANISQKCKLQAGDVFISSFLPSTGGQGSEQRHFSLNNQAEEQDSPRQAILYGYNNKSNKKKQVKAKSKSKSKKQFQCGIRTGFFSATLLSLTLSQASWCMCIF